MKENSNGSFDCFREFMVTSNSGWHGMASFAERGLTPHPAKKKSKCSNRNFRTSKYFEAAPNTWDLQKRGRHRSPLKI